ncbi:MAG TPA: glycosyltransferase family 4 protein [Saprospiraceae bacterium]|nr:glycosyltransferase family 4 protein [Saprospiraceae bacterium]HMP13708.1 glycosyltransferase family 4 protein [Saprospiraceae bacterium]
MNPPKVAIISRLPAPYFEPLFQKIEDFWQNKLIVLYECRGRVGTAWGIEKTGFEGKYTYKKVYFEDTPQEGLNKLWYSLRGVFWGIKQLNKHKPDIVIIHGYFFPLSWAALMWCVVERIPYSLRSDSNGFINSSSGIKAIIKMWFLKKLTRGASSFLYIGTANKAYWQKYGATDSQLIEAKYAVDDRIFFPTATPRTIDRTVFLFVGRLIPRKNVLLLLEAFKQMQDSWDKMELIIAGTGPQESQVQLFIEQNPEMPIRFLGRVSPADMPSLYQNADILVCPYEREPWGLTINEAMSCGLAIIAATNGTCGAAVDLMIDGQNGVGLSDLSSKQLEQAMQYLAADRDRLERMKKESLKIIAGWKYDSAVSGFIEATERHKRKDKP